MISEVITYLNTVLDGMPYFSTNYGMCELKKNKGVTQPIYYVGSKYDFVKPQGLGLTYWRKRDDVNMASTESYVSCGNESVFTYRYRLFAMTSRELFPADDAFSPDRFADTILKGITLNGGNLKRSIGARSLKVFGSLYSTDTEKILSNEFTGTSVKDFRFCDLVISMDVDIEIRKDINCIEEACDYVPRFCLQLENYVALPS